MTITYKVHAWLESLIISLKLAVSLVISDIRPWKYMSAAIDFRDPFVKSSKAEYCSIRTSCMIFLTSLTSSPDNTGSLEVAALSNVAII